MATSGGKKSSGKQNPEIAPKTAIASRGKMLISIGVGVVVIAVGFLSLNLYQRHNDKLRLASASQSLSGGMKPGGTKNILPKLSPTTAQKPITESRPDNKAVAQPMPAKTQPPQAEVIKREVVKTEVTKTEAPKPAIAKPEISVASVATKQAPPKQIPPKTLASKPAPPKVEATKAEAPKAAEVPKIAVKPAVPQIPKPRFDIVRVEPDGTAVIAGRASPGAEVEVMSGKKSIGKMKSNTRGEWVLVLEKPLKPGAHDLSIVSHQPNSKIKQHSQQKVAVAVPVRRDEKPLVVLSRKDKPSQVLQLPEPTKQRAVPKGKLALKIVDYDNTGRIVFTGSATPGATARIYVDNRFLRDAAVDRAGAWQLRARAEIPPGNHKLRIDELDKIGKVTARIQLPFTRAQPVDVAAINKLRNALKATAEKPKPASASPPVKAVSRPAPAAPPQTQMAAKPSTPTTMPTVRMTVTVPKETVKASRIEPVISQKPAKTSEVSAPPTMPKQVATQPASRPATQQMAPKTIKSAPEPKQQMAVVRKPALRGGMVKQPDVQAPKAPATRASKVSVQKETVAAPAQPVPTEQKPQMQAANQPAAPVEAQPVLSSGIVIQPGNNLWNISRVVYGEGAQYTVIYQANTDQIRDPDLIFPGQIFKTPGAKPPRVIPPDRREPITK